MKKNVYLVLFLALLFVACDSDDMKYYDKVGDIPSVTTGKVENAFGLGAVISGDATADNGSWIQSKGICVSTNSDPQITVDEKTSAIIDGDVNDSIGVFNSLILGLTPNTNYYYRAYALNASGIAYGEVKTFNSGEPPVFAGIFESVFFEDSWPVEVEMVPDINYYNVREMYDTGYDIRLQVSNTSVTIASQPAWYNPNYGDVYIQGSGTFDGKVFTLKIQHSVPGVGSWAATTEVLTLE